MKRLLPVLVLLVLLAAGLAFYYARKPGHRNAAALAMVGDLPQDTLLLFAIPDPGQTAANWKTTDLYKIWQEPDVQSFLAMPLSKIPPDKERDDALAQAARLKPTNLFIALTSLDEKTNQPHLLAGFQFQGDSHDVDHLLQPAKDGYRQKYPAGKADLINYQGHAIETFATGDGTTIASVYLADWYFVTNDAELLKATIDRIENRVATPSLEKDADFRAVSARLPSGSETLIFARVQPILRRIFDLATASGQPINAEARKEAEKGRAVGATTKIENGKIRDTICYLAPGLRQDLAHLELGSLALTSADTLLYYSGVFQVPDQIDLPADTTADSPLPNPAAILRGIGRQLQTKGITGEAIRAAFASEAAFQLVWPANHAQPTVLVSVAVKDQAAAEKITTAVASVPLGTATWGLQQAGALTIHTLTLPNIDAFRPAVAVTAKNLIIGLNVLNVKEAAAREQSGAPNISQGATYKEAVAELEKPNLAFSFVDTRTLFERIYGVVKPAALLGAAFLYPQVNSYADLSKLPPVDAIAKHLSPTVMSATMDKDGELIESIGSVTLFQAGSVVIGGAAAAAVPFMESQFGGLLNPTIPGKPGPAARALPSVLPPASPTSSPSSQQGANH